MILWFRYKICDYNFRGETPSIQQERNLINLKAITVTLRDKNLSDAF